MTARGATDELDDDAGVVMADIAVRSLKRSGWILFVIDMMEKGATDHLIFYFYIPNV
jgi:hypothetical protein